MRYLAVRETYFQAIASFKNPYLAAFEAAKKWTITIRNLAKAYKELSIMYEARLPE